MQDIAESEPFGDIGAHARISLDVVIDVDWDEDDEDEGRATTPLESCVRHGGRSLVAVRWWTFASFRRRPKGKMRGIAQWQYRIDDDDEVEDDENDQCARCWEEV